MVRGRPSKVLNEVLTILKEYLGVLTLRQIYYRLVAKGVIKNKQSSYTNLAIQCKKARVKGIIPWDRIEDRSRALYDGESAGCLSVEEIYEDAIDDYENAEDTLRETPDYCGLPQWYGQPEYIEIWTEKDALTGIFQPICEKHKLTLAVCKGYQSIGNIHNAVKRFQGYKERKTSILYFGDYDPRGQNIPEIIKQDFESLNCPITMRKIALTREQIEQYRLVPAPCKKKDTMAKKWIDSEGDNVWELDALDPNTLANLVNSAILAHVDEDIYNVRNQLIYERVTTVRKKISEYLGDSKE